MGKRYPDRSASGPRTLHGSVVAAEIDLHGLPVHPARIRVEGFLRTQQTANPGRVVRIVTGRGNRSEGGRPVLREMVLELVRDEMSELVDEHAVEMGQGAVLVRVVG